MGHNKFKRDPIPQASLCHRTQTVSVRPEDDFLQSVSQEWKINRKKTTPYLKSSNCRTGRWVRTWQPITNGYSFSGRGIVLIGLPGRIRIVSNRCSFWPCETKTDKSTETSRQSYILVTEYDEKRSVTKVTYMSPGELGEKDVREKNIIQMALIYLLCLLQVYENARVIGDNTKKRRGRSGTLYENNIFARLCYRVKKTEKEKKHICILYIYTEVGWKCKYFQ